MREPLLTIVGPTAAGKSDLAMALAKRYGGEIVSADSRQVYRYMDVGTAKPSERDRSTVPHHLIDVVDPDEEYSLAHFLRQAADAIRDIRRRAKLPLLVGGTGQYLRALLEGWRVPEVPPNPDLRQGLERRARADGHTALHRELAGLDPVAAGRIDSRNVRRVIRALELVYSSPDGEVGPLRKTPPSYRTKVLGLTRERAALYRRIDDRVDAMMESGWVGEVRGLLDRGYDRELPSLTSLGYGELVRHLDGDLSLDSAVAQIKHRTHRFARHQYAWFRPGDERIHWFDARAGWHDPVAAVARWLESGEQP